ncbi:hypothetical protein ACOMHN_003161 [Nucella lapillus]
MSDNPQKELRDLTAVEATNPQHSINNGDPRPIPVDPENSENVPSYGATLTDSESRNGEPTRCGLEDSTGSRSSRNRSQMADWTEEQVEQLRRRLKFFFMDPCSKFRARRHIPWKMSLQFLKIIIITVQIIQFGGQRSDVVEYFEHNQNSMKHLLLKGWDASYETMPYQPATGKYALYTVEELLDSVQFAWQQYYNLSQTSLATITLLREGENGTIIPIRLCNSFNDYSTYPNGSYVIGSGVRHNCTDLVPLKGKNPYDIRAFLVERSITIPFRKLLELTLEFAYNTFHLNQVETHYGPICYRVHSTIKFINNQRSGQVLINLPSTITQRVCSGKIMSSDAQDQEELIRDRSVGFDGTVIAICVLSILLCGRSLFRAWRLKRLTERMFLEHQGVTLIFDDRMEFVNLWYFLIIVNDIITIIGAAYKIQLETRTVSITSFNYDWCSLMLGLGGLLAWIGCLRYLSLFKKYNILIVTLKTAFPNMVRFSLCALAMYCGFMFCGWVILGPYHIKFRHLSTTSECLFSLVNGDDMFVTFSATETDNLLVWYFARIYLYAFISLFIYCVLSLFIAVIMDTYETIKGYRENCPDRTDLWHFIEECNHPLHSGLYRRQHTEDKGNDCSLIEIITLFCCRASGVPV